MGSDPPVFRCSPCTSSSVVRSRAIGQVSAVDPFYIRDRLGCGRSQMCEYLTIKTSDNILEWAARLQGGVWRSLPSGVYSPELMCATSWREAGRRTLGLHPWVLPSGSERTEEQKTQEQKTQEQGPKSKDPRAKDRQRHAVVRNDSRRPAASGRTEATWTGKYRDRTVRIAPAR